MNDDQNKKPTPNPAMFADDIMMGLRKALRTPKIAAAKKKEEPEESKMPRPPLISYLDDVAMILKGIKSEGPAIAGAVAKAAAEGAKHHQNTVGTTLESKIHESFTVASDRLFRAGIMNTKERIALSGAIGDVLGGFRKKIDPELYARKMTDNAHEHLKAAVSNRFIKTRLVARDLANRPNVSGYALGEAAKSVEKAKLDAPTGEVRKILRGAVSFTRSMTKSQPQKTTEFVGKIKDKIGPQEKLV